MYQYLVFSEGCAGKGEIARKTLREDFAGPTCIHDCLSRSRLVFLGLGGMNAMPVVFSLLLVPPTSSQVICFNIVRFIAMHHRSLSQVQTCVGWCFSRKTKYTAGAESKPAAVLGLRFVFSSSFPIPDRSSRASGGVGFQ
jgi:hypothetical protein